MTRICGTLQVMEPPRGGGFIRTTTEYTDGTTETSSTKNRMVFPLIHIGDVTLKNSLVANDQLGSEVATNANVGEHVCLFVYGHLLRRKGIIGLQCADGRLYSMPSKGYYTGLFWYLVFSPFFVGLAGAFIGMLVGSIGGKKGTAFGLLCGVLYGVGISWFSAYRFHKAFQEVKAVKTGQTRPIPDSSRQQAES